MKPQIICDHLQSLTVYARYLTKNRDTAEELIQELALHILAAPKAALQVDHPKAYLKTMLRNRFLDQQRKLARAPRQISLEETEIPDTRMNFRRELDEAQSAIAMLPTDQRQILLLRVRHEMSYEALAAELNLPLGTVMSRLNRARAVLRAQVGR